MEKKIKSVKKNGIEFKFDETGQMFYSLISNDKNYTEFVSGEVVLNCPLFEIEYEQEVPTEIEELKKQLQYCIEGLEKIVSKYGGNK